MSEEWDTSDKTRKVLKYGPVYKRETIDSSRTAKLYWFITLTWSPIGHVPTKANKLRDIEHHKQDAALAALVPGVYEPSQAEAAIRQGLVPGVYESSQAEAAVHPCQGYSICWKENSAITNK